MTTPIKRTPVYAGKMESGKPFEIFDTSGRGRPVQSLTITWNGKVLKGFSIRFWGQQNAVNGGDWNDWTEKLARATLELKEDDLLQQVRLETTDYGKGSVKQIGIVTRDRTREWPGSDQPFNTTLNVKDHAFMGIYGAMNADNFINALGLLINDTDEESE